MSVEELRQIANYLAVQGKAAISINTEAEQGTLDYVAIFAKNEEEFDDLVQCAQQLGKEVDQTMSKTGKTYRLAEPLVTDIGTIPFLKIRLPDPTRPQRGAPDFVVKDYLGFKAKYLGKSGNFTLMPHRNGEMVELKGVDVLVYIKSEPYTA